MDTAEDRVRITSYAMVLQALGRFHLLPRLRFLYTERNERQLLFLGSPHLRMFLIGKPLTDGDDANHVQSFLDLLSSKSPKTKVLFLRFQLLKRPRHAIRQKPEP